MRARKENTLTTPDLVLLSLLAERPMHGYEANAELERRQVRDWAGISRPQIYYSLNKLVEAGLLREGAASEPGRGPDRRVLGTTAKGRGALAAALDRDDWTTQRDRPAFLTWMALSWQAAPGTFRKQIHRRESFLEHEVIREEKTLEAVLKEVGHPRHEAVWMLRLTIEQFLVELEWLKRVKRESKRRDRRAMRAGETTYGMSSPHC